MSSRPCDLTEGYPHRGIQKECPLKEKVSIRCLWAIREVLTMKSAHTKNRQKMPYKNGTLRILSAKALPAEGTQWNGRANVIAAVYF